ncbi:MAG: hypothetical protein HOA41_06740, partial [Rhodospirillales bacterium]|jgi:hypothetical protein|nr:hypothetical protein [Rhodospirillales bacterium]
VTTKAQHFSFDPAAISVSVIDCPDFTEWVMPLLNGWTLSALKASDAKPSAITVSRKGDTFHLESNRIKGNETYHGRIYIACGFLVELMVAYGYSDDRLISLHAGGVVMDDKLVLFPASGKTGKSLLTAQCAFRGAAVFSDDIIPVNVKTGNACALGVAPRMRLPIPDSISAESAAWIKKASGLTSKHYAYLDLATDAPESLLAPVGEERPLGAIIRLFREEGTSPKISEASRPEIMRLMIRQHFGAAPATEMVEQFAHLVTSVPCYNLHYGGGDDALELLEDTVKAI